MATPIVAASTVLIRPKLKEMLERPVLKNLKGDDKIDLTSLTKNSPTKYCTPYDGCNFLERKKSILCIT